MSAILHKRAGFTLVELLVVIIIVGILAAVAVPMMVSNVDKAKRTEAIAAMGSIRTAERLYATENSGAYTTVLGELTPYLDLNDLDGANYSQADYTITTNTIIANSATNALDCSMNLQTGAITQ